MNDAIDLGEWIVPTSWEDISLLKYESIERFYADKDEKFDLRQVLHIMCDKTEDEINALPVEFLEMILDKMSFINEPPKAEKPTNKIIIDGETYIINVMEKLKTGEYIAADTALKANRHDYASLLAILCRKEGEKYDSTFEAELFQKRKEMFEQQPITSILAVVSFFLNLCLILEIPSRLFTVVEEEIKRTQRDIKTSTKLGACKKYYFNLQAKKLLKSLKSTKSI